MAPVQQTVEITEEQVEALQKRIAELERLLVEAQRFATIGTLSARIAHELNNILTAIIGHSDHAMKYDEQELKEKAVRKSAECGERAAVLVRGFLDFASKPHKEPQTVKATDLMDAAVELIEWDLKKDAIQVVKKYKTTAQLNVIPSDIEQVFLNLILNARQAMKPNGGTLTLEVREGKTPAEVAFCFTDTGCGIEPANLGKIFDPFFTTSTDGKGTGLGLPVAQEIVEEAGGTIEVESTPGVGTTFTVYLPVSGGN